MLSREAIMKIANENKLKKESLIQKVIEFVKECDLDAGGWRYYPIEEVWRCRWLFKIDNSFKTNWRDSFINYKCNGISIQIGKDPVGDNWYDMEATIEIDPSISNTEETAWLSEVCEKLKSKRKELYFSWKMKTLSTIEEYFKEECDTICEYPSTYVNKDGYIESPMFILWSRKKDYVCKNIYDKMGALLNLDYESLNDFYPCFWSSNESLKEHVSMGSYILEVTRSSAPDFEFNHGWEDVSVRFIMRYTEDSRFSLAMTVGKQNGIINKYKNFNSFISELVNSKEWMLDPDGSASLIIPINYDERANFILKEARSMFGYMFEFVNVEQKVPIYDKRDAICIKVILKN